MDENERRKKSVALKYNKDVDTAPVVIAKGVGEVAEAIIEIAKEKGIPIVENPELVEDLFRLEIYSEIPEELYKVVAEVLAFVYGMGEYE
ncbi:MAG: EscU/YscU/HrcU family type III secretion system export apparatus switch protein [Thermotogae bacterium]|nr:EscU/YscU/HrcU family type III secretion system export apparatus switch protein [Thermotogota bacterium]